MTTEANEVAILEKRLVVNMRYFIANRRPSVFTHRNHNGCEYVDLVGCEYFFYDHVAVSCCHRWWCANL